MTFYVCCPAGFESGGPEALHQLDHALRRAGHESYLSYFPFGDAHEVPRAYRHYGSVPRRPVDSAQSVIVVPETMTTLLGRFPAARGAVWWLSVDGYAGARHRLWLEDVTLFAWRRLSGASLPFGRLRPYTHAAQSEFARQYLRRHRLCAVMLSDYIADELLPPPPQDARRASTILYNPRKGFSITKRLMSACPEYRFAPLAGLSRGELRERFGQSMVYIDFGHHPGKDRIPREAALGGCIVITNRRGSAGAANDVPIMDKYKIDDRHPGFVSQFKRLVHGVVTGYAAAARDFDGFVGGIRAQKTTFLAEAAAFAEKLTAER